MAGSASASPKGCLNERDEGHLQLDAVLHCSSADLATACEVREWLNSLHCPSQDQQTSPIRTELLCHVHGAHNEAETLSVAAKATSTFIILRTPAYEEDPGAKRVGQMLVSMSVHSRDLRVIHLASGHSLQQLLDRDRSAACVFAFDYNPESAFLRQLMAGRLAKTRLSSALKTSPELVETVESAWGGCNDQKDAASLAKESTSSCYSLESQASLSSITKKHYNNVHLDNRLCEDRNMHSWLRILDTTQLSALSSSNPSHDGSFEVCDNDGSSSNPSIWPCSRKASTDQVETRRGYNCQLKDPQENSQNNEYSSPVHSLQVFPSETLASDHSNRNSSSSNGRYHYDNIRDSISDSETAQATVKVRLEAAVSSETVYEGYEPDSTLQPVPEAPKSPVPSSPRSDALTENTEKARSAINSILNIPSESDHISVTEHLPSKFEGVVDPSTGDYDPILPADQHVYNSITGKPVIQGSLLKPSPRKPRPILRAFSRMILCGSRFSGKKNHARRDDPYEEPIGETS